MNRRARFEYSVLCPEICLHLASYLNSPLAFRMPNYPFPNLKTILAKSNSSNFLNFHNPSICEIRPRSFRTLGILSFQSHQWISTLSMPPILPMLCLISPVNLRHGNICPILPPVKYVIFFKRPVHIRTRTCGYNLDSIVFCSEKPTPNMNNMSHFSLIWLSK